MMKKFKFFQSKYVSNIPQELPFTNRRYPGLTRGSITWVDYPTVRVHYMEPTASYDPINEDDIPLLNLELRFETHVLEARWINSLNEFLDYNRNSYILMLNLCDTESNIYNENSPSIPTDIRLMFRGITFL